MTRLNDTSSAISLLKTRKSASVKAMVAPGPTPEQLKTILEIAVRVPDHGKLTPWRLVLFEGEARRKFGEIIKTRWQELHPEHGTDALAFQAGLFLRAPTVLVVVSKAGPHVKIPEWEQLMSAGAACMNLVWAANALGFATAWLTEWYAYDRRALDLLGLKPDEKLVGFVHIGGRGEPADDRVRPALADVVTRL